MKKSIKTIFCVAVLATTIFTGCKKDKDETPNPTSTPAPPAETFTFVKVNNQWKYNATLKGYPAPGQDTTFVDAVTQTILSDEGSGNFKVPYVLSTSWAAFTGGENDTMYWYKDNNIFAEKWDISSPNTIILKSNSAVGDAYTSIDGMDTTFVKVLSLTETLTVPAGTFNDLQKIKIYYSKNDENLSYEYRYMNKSVGIVQSVIYEGVEVGSYNLRMKNF